MPMNKLSELSKPAAFIVRSPRGDVAYRTISQADADYIARKGFVSEPLYSQEYVSALKHESAVNWEAAASLNVENQELKKRIAELEERLKLVREQRDNELRTNAILEKRLATPVRLPKTNGYWTEQEKAFEDAITLAKRAVRLAGFTVEGDE